MKIEKSKLEDSLNALSKENNELRGRLSGFGEIDRVKSEYER